MSYSFGSSSKKRLKECHPDLQKIMNEAIKITDFSVLCGHRTKQEQDKAFRSGRSKLKFPESKHNQTPSLAIDVVPFPIDWNDTKRFVALYGIIRGIAHMMDIKIRWGGNWDMDDEIITDQNFNDLPHFELV